jgi:hypothetical protein
MIDENPERARDKQDIIEKILSDLGLKISIVTPSKVGYEFSEIIRNTGWKITPQTSDFPMSPIQDFAMGNIPDWVSLPIRYAHWNLRYAEYYCHHDKDRAVRHFAKACLRILHLIEESNLTIQSIQDAYAIIDHACQEQTLTRNGKQLIRPALSAYYFQDSTVNHDDLTRSFRNWLTDMEIPDYLFKLPDMTSDGLMPRPV